MDPDTALEFLRIAVRKLSEETADWVDVKLLVEQFEALDDWLTRGGHLPSAWCVRRPTVLVSAPRYQSDQNRIGQ